MVPMCNKWIKQWEKPSAAPKIKTSFFYGLVGSVLQAMYNSMLDNIY